MVGVAGTGADVTALGVNVLGVAVMVKNRVLVVVVLIPARSERTPQYAFSVVCDNSREARNDGRPEESVALRQRCRSQA